MSDWKNRLLGTLEPALKEKDPRPKLSAYNSMPFAIFHYPPTDEFAVRTELSLLKTRLEHAGKRVTVISLAECLADALEKSGMTVEALAEAERKVGVDPVVEQVSYALSYDQPLNELVVNRLPKDPDPLRDVVFITRAGALFPFYRTSALLEQLHGKMGVPGILFYPGEIEGSTGLKFMGVTDADHNYRPRIF